MRILLADDNPNDRLLLSAWLNGEGHTCVEATDGAAALDILRQECPDLIISDILMPHLDGFAFCRTVKRDPAWRHIYFIFCTATYTSEEDAALALQLGVQRFLTKPVDVRPASLRHRLPMVQFHGWR
jgi:CheY-like chemotaxis protein